jgi:hypothetical protein
MLQTFAYGIYRLQPCHLTIEMSRHHEDSDDTDENEKNNILKKTTVLPIVVPVSLLFPVISKGMMEQWKGFLVSHL